MAELKPCPFCGGKAKVVPNEYWSEVLNDWKVDFYSVECRSCRATSKRYMEKERTITAWNKRADNG